MRTKTLLACAVTTCLVIAGFAGPAGAAKKKKKQKGPVVVGTDAAGDWGQNVDATIAPIGDALGQDLVEASFELADKETLNFVIKVNALPPTGGVPEASRYTWDFVVEGGNAYQLSGAFTEFIRGVCNPLHTGQCPPPQNPGTAPFFLRHGPCTVGDDCFVAAVINSTFDAATGTITIPVPLEAMEAKAGSKIVPGVTSFGGTIYAAPAVLVSYPSLPADTMTVLDTYKIPKS